MADATDRMKAFEARLATLKRKMEAGLGKRASELRQAAEALEGGVDDSRRALKSHAHRLRGVAGTYGHQDLTDLAARLEGQAASTPAPGVVALARQLADLAEQVGRDSQPPSELVSSAAGPARLRERMGVDRLSTAKHGGAATRVLAIDDDPITIRLLTLTLGGVGGFDATLVDSATEGLELLKTQQFDLVISDAMMPDMNGQDFCRAARCLDGPSARVPILILSAATADELGWTRAESGHSGWLRKPFRPSELVSQITDFLARSA